MSVMHEVTRDVNDEVVAKLVELQGHEKDGAFALRLGVTRSHWAHIKAGRRKVSYALAKRAAGVFPAILPILMRDLSGAA
jgi:hypothetical protein